MTRENTIVTSGAARIERIVLRRTHDCYARFSWPGPEELPFDKPWWACTAYLEDGHTKIAVTGEEFLTVEQAFVLGIALSMAIDWAAEEGERETASRATR